MLIVVVKPKICSRKGKSNKLPIMLNTMLKLMLAYWPQGLKVVLKLLSLLSPSGQSLFSVVLFEVKFSTFASIFTK